MSDDFLHSMESFLSSVQQELSNKIKNLNSRLDKLTETNKDLIKGFKQKNSVISKDDDNFNPYRKVLDLEEELQKVKRKNYTLEKELSSFKKSDLSGGESLNMISTDAAEYILSHLKSSLKDLVLSLNQNPNLDEPGTSELDQLDEVEKQYVTETEQQTIDERIASSSEIVKISKDFNHLKKTYDQLLNVNKKSDDLIENLQRELNYKKQEADALQKTIHEGELEGEILKNENIEMKKEILEYKFSLNDIEQRSHESILEIERNELDSKEAESTEDFYKKELNELRNTLGKRKLEIKELKKMISESSLTKSDHINPDNEKLELISTLKKTIEEKNNLINNLKSDTEQLEILNKKYSNLESKLKNIIVEGKRLGLEESLDLEDQLNQFKLLVKVSERVYAPKGYLTVLKYLTNNPNWVDLHYLSKQINMNPGVIHNIILELVDLSLAEIDEENNKAKAYDNPT